MVWDNKVVWSEGMFLRTQHFQQQDRYVERLVRDAAAGLASFGWGVRELRLNTALLETGKLALSECQGVLPDGTPFAVPDDADHPPPLELGEAAREGVVYLAAPVHQPGTAEVDPADAPDGGARFRGQRFEATDAVAGMGGGAPIEVGRLRLRLLHETEDRAGYVGLGIARVLEVRADRRIVLDPGYIPPCLHAGASPVLAGYLSELEGKITSLGDELARVVADPRSTGVAEVADFLMLLLVNRSQPVIAHLAALGRVHPEPLYGYLAGLAGEFATFTSATRRPPAFPVYRLALVVLPRRVGTALQQPVHHLEAACGSVNMGDRPAYGRTDVHIRTTLHQYLHVLPLVLLDEGVEQQRLVVGVAGIGVAAVGQQQLQVHRVVLSGGPNHGVGVVADAAVPGLVGSRHVGIGAVLLHRPQPFGTLGVDGPGQQWEAAAGAAEDHILVHPFLAHQSAHLGGIATLGGHR
jgi:hypothetical protein